MIVIAATATHTQNARHRAAGDSGIAAVGEFDIALRLSARRSLGE
jgi:hypothetical protein